MTDVQNLSDHEAIVAVQALVGHWAEARGLEALVAWQALNSPTKGQQLPAFLMDPDENDVAAAAACRKILAVVLDGNSPEARRWAAVSVAAAKQPKAHIFDPLSLAIMGATAIGLVLAARVKKIGSFEFYEGLPAGTEKLVGGAVGAMSGVPQA